MRKIEVFWDWFTAGAKAFREENYTDAVQFLTSAAGYLSTHQEDPQKIALGVLKARALQHMDAATQDDYQIAVKCATSAFERLSAVYGHDHPGRAPIAKLLSVIHGQLQTYWDMVAGHSMAASECPAELDKIPAHLRPSEEDFEAWKNSMISGGKSELILDSATARMHEIIRNRKERR